MTLYTEQSQDTKDEYPTKPELWRPLARAVGGFDVDPASGCEPEAIATTCYTEEENGLEQQWNGRVWLNPPFSDKTQWYRKAVNEVTAGNAEVVVALAPVDTSTQWFHNWFSRANVICWLEGRDWYEANGSPSFNTAIGVFGQCPNDLVSALESFGVVTETVSSVVQTELPLTG